MEQRKDGGVGADPESQRENCGGGEAGCTAQPAKPVAEILGGAFEPGYAAPVANLFLGLGDAAEFAERGGACVSGFHSLLAKFLFLHGKMEGDFFVQFAVQTVSAKETAQAPPEYPHGSAPIRRGEGIAPSGPLCAPTLAIPARSASAPRASVGRIWPCDWHRWCPSAMQSSRAAPSAGARDTASPG